MIRLIADTMITPLGASTETNLAAVLAGRSALGLHEHTFPKVEPFCASLFDERLSFTELCIRCVANLQPAYDDCLRDERTIFVFSTTKGDNLRLWQPAVEVAQHFGNTNPPFVVSNACISGVCAQIAAERLLQSGQYDRAVVVGCDIQTPFIVSGFQSFKALSQDPCQPFDANRKGLNLGEAAAAMILERIDDTTSAGDKQPLSRVWTIMKSSCHNDANHISGPSRTGEGSLRCLKDVLEVEGGAEGLAFVNVHGTATLYNDEMESIAIARAGLSETPVNALKGCYGHTMGAAGILETILSMKALEKGLVIGTRGFKTLGTTEKVNISADNRPAMGNNFIKLLSGFGGCNAAIRWKME